MEVLALVQGRPGNIIYLVERSLEDNICLICATLGVVCWSGSVSSFDQDIDWYQYLLLVLNLDISLGEYWYLATGLARLGYRIVSWSGSVSGFDQDWYLFVCHGYGYFPRGLADYGYKTGRYWLRDLPLGTSGI